MRRAADIECFERGARLGAALMSGAPVTTALIRQRFGVSRATAKRDLLRLERALAATRDVAPDGAHTLRLAAAPTL